jgi:hypothetical protein
MVISRTVKFDMHPKKLNVHSLDKVSLLYAHIAQFLQISFDSVEKNVISLNLCEVQQQQALLLPN